MRHSVIIFLCIVLTKGFKPVPLENIGDFRIIDGQHATIGQFAWQAALFLQKEQNSNFWFCSGSIIGKEWILTAAHCLEDAQYGLLYAGIIDLSVEISPTSMPVQFIMHKDYDSITLANDIGLVRLSTPLKFDETTKPIGLSSEVLGVNAEITVSGWGKTNQSGHSISSLLNYVNLFIISNEECEALYGNSGRILPGMVCALGEDDTDESPCSGDSGSPVVIDADTNPKQVAVTSFISDEGCATGAPSGYVRIAAYTEWIKSITNI